MSSKLFSIEGLNILISGSSRGIGYILAQEFGKLGAKVFINGRNSDQLNEAAKKLSAEGMEVHAYSFDVSDENQVKSSISQILDEHKSIDVLVNNAGIQIRKPLEEFEYENWRKIMDVNVTSAFLMSKAVVPQMIARKKGKIINICSLMSEIARPTIAPYTTSKGALKNLTKAMATDWAKYNIQVNGIGPGYFSSEMTKNLVQDEQFNSWICNRTPAGRWGQLEELAGAAIFLSSEASSFVNGQIIYVDGGILACV